MKRVPGVWGQWGSISNWWWVTERCYLPATGDQTVYGLWPSGWWSMRYIPFTMTWPNCSLLQCMSMIIIWTLSPVNFEDCLRLISVCGDLMLISSSNQMLISCIGFANERRRYMLTPSFIGWAHTQNDPCPCPPRLFYFHYCIEIIPENILFYFTTQLSEHINWKHIVQMPRTRLAANDKRIYYQANVLSAIISTIKGSIVPWGMITFGI